MHNKRQFFVKFFGQLSNDQKNNVSLSNSWDCPTNVTLTEETYKNNTLLRFFIGIALDIIPEIRRYNRDFDVEVNMTNVQTDFKDYYQETKKDEITYLNDKDFDFRSPMLFDSNFGIETNESTYNATLYKDYQYFSGFRSSFRLNDYKHMLYYYCNEDTRVSDCAYGGHYPKSGSKECKCPEYLDPKEKCLNFYKSNGKCGEKTKFNASSQEKTHSVNIFGRACYFNITFQERKNVTVTIQKLQINGTLNLIFTAFLEALVRKDKGAAGLHFNKNISSNITLPALSHQVFLVVEGKANNISLQYSYKEDDSNKTEELKKWEVL
uniref:Astacin domain-containing protein n=1 Tax=Strongyloides papillosus TaxID=174720 RepID=A0A0N5BJH1_STREA